MAFASAATLAPSAATAISAGSATVVPKPTANAKTRSALRLPLRANALAIASPSGNRPISRPRTNRVRPQGDENDANDDALEVRKGLLKDDQLKKGNNQRDRR